MRKFRRITASSLYADWSTSSPQLPNLFWITASDGFVSWNENLLNFQMFIWSKTHIETPGNECSEISVQNPILPAPKTAPNNPTRYMCAKFTWVAKTEKVFMCFLFEFSIKHLAQSIAWGSVFNILFCRNYLCLGKNNTCWLLLDHPRIILKNFSFWGISNYSQFCICTNL